MSNSTVSGPHHGQRGITGLDSAIIVTTAILVASLLAAIVIGAGIFFSKKAGEVVGTGISGMTSVIELSGTVIARDADGDSNVDTIEFDLESVLGAESGIDLSVTTDTNGDGILSNEETKLHTMVISYLDKGTILEDIACTKSSLGKNDRDDLLEAGEKFHIAVNLAALPKNNQLGSFDTFAIQIIPLADSPLSFQKTLPPVMSSVMTFD